VFCIQCGAEALASARFCHSCGTSIPAETPKAADLRPAPSIEPVYRPARAPEHTWRCSSCSGLNRPGSLACSCGQHFSADQPVESDVPALKAPARTLSGGWRIARDLTRVAMASVSVSLALMSRAAAKDTSAPETPVIAFLFALAGGLLTFGVFFWWRFTRVALFAERDGESRGEIRRQSRSLGLVLIVSSVLGLVVSSLSFIGWVDLPLAPPEVILLTFLALILSVSCGVTGLGLRRETPWARRAALILGFAFFGGIPIGTGLAVYIWWFTASSAVREHFDHLARGRRAAVGG
jgi:hypothetical protein